VQPKRNPQEEFEFVVGPNFDASTQIPLDKLKIARKFIFTEPLKLLDHLLKGILDKIENS
jgi:hypothetical protein